MPHESGLVVILHMKALCVSGIALVDILLASGELLVVELLVVLILAVPVDRSSEFSLADGPLRVGSAHLRALQTDKGALARGLILELGPAPLALPSLESLQVEGRSLLSSQLFETE